MMSFTPIGTPRSSAAFGLVGRARLLERERRIEMDPRLHDRIALGDAVEAGLHQLLRGERAGFDRLRRLRWR